jgi:hypothetical protein
MALQTFDQLIEQAKSQAVSPTADPLLIEALTRNSAQRAANLPIAMGAMLSGDKGVQGVGNVMYKDAAAAKNLIPLGEEGFVDPTTGTFMVSPVGADKRQQRILELAMRQANSNDQKALAAQTAAATAAQTQAFKEAQLAQANQFKEAMLEIQRDRTAILQQNATTRADAAAAGKPIPVSQQMEMSGQRSNIRQFDALAGGFKDEFGGAKFNTVGELQNWLGRTGIDGSYKPQANWWQNYQDLFNQQLKLLSGSAVTASEAIRFEKAAITPNMDPGMIRTRLAQQQRILAETHNALVSSLKQGGYNTSDYGNLPVLDGTGPGQLQGAPANTAAPAGNNSDITVRRLD